MSSPHCFHCSPSLTKLNDGDKCRVILNLSYHKGNSLNDFVDKQHFDHNKFTLKFPTIDGISLAARGVNLKMSVKVFFSADYSRLGPQ